MGIFLKRSTTTGAIPNANQLEYGELAINAADGKLYTKTTGGIITQLGNVIQSPTLPIGSITSAATNIFQPPDYLPCTGGSYNTSEYPDLASILGPSYSRSGVHSIGIYANVKRMIYANGVFSCLPIGGNLFARWANVSNLNSWGIQSLAIPGFTSYSNGEYIKNSGVICMISDNLGRVLRSTTNGTSWSYATPVGLPSVAHTFSCASSDKEIACIITNGPTSLTTSNGGISFNIGNMNNRNWQGVAASDSVFCAVAYGSNICAVSSDGLNWTEYELPASGNWSAIAYNTSGSFFCTVSYGSNMAATSPDGTVWTLRTMSDTGNWTGIGYHSGINKFLAVTNSSTGALSSDGINWTQTTLPSFTYKTVVSDGNIFMVNQTTNNTVVAVTIPGWYNLDSKCI